MNLSLMSLEFPVAASGVEGLLAKASLSVDRKLYFC
jgi:hypothetical protein